MLGSCIEKTIYLKGLCKVVNDHPLVDVDHLGLCIVPKNAELSSMLTGLVTVRLKYDPLIEDQAREFALGGLSVWLVRPDQLRGLNAQQTNADFWKENPKAKLQRNVDGVAVAHFSHRHQVMVGPCPMLQFIGTVSVKTARASGHRRSLS